MSNIEKRRDIRRNKMSKKLIISKRYRRILNESSNEQKTKLEDVDEPNLTYFIVHKRNR